ncbi:MAG: 4'-phosphopantetheinyl transferase superfamily protein [Bdellovibrionaceae bacterium]|nr:4'-phosphopantetheinyl transferase superfamily protein [Pseudobdellovibrionaceae bacterium]
MHSKYDAEHFTPPLLPPRYSSLRIFRAPHLGSQHKDHRTLLRKMISDTLVAEGHSAPEHVDDLDQRLQHDSLSISVSHTIDASIFAWIPKPLQVGVDIELVNRITDPVIERVSTEEEVNTAPDVKLLWTAKEAVFKAISPQAKTMSEIEIYNWQPVSGHTYTFQTRRQPSGEIIDGFGSICLSMSHFLSFFVFEH